MGQGGLSIRHNIGRETIVLAHSPALRLRSSRRSFVFNGLSPEEMRSANTTRAQETHGGFLYPTPIGRSRKVRRAASLTGSIIQSSTSPGTTRRPIVHGRARACPPKRNGNWPRAAAWTRRRLPGATSLSLAESIATTSGRVNSPTATPWTTAISARRRFTPFRRTDTACTMSPETSRNGVRAIFRRAITASHHHVTP